jgi:hypothetical protein
MSQKSTRIHNTQNPVVLKPRLAVEPGAKPKRTNEESDSEKMAAVKLKHEPEFYSSKNGAVHSNRGAAAAMRQGGEASRRSSRRKPRRHEKTGHAGDPAERTSRDLSHRAAAALRRRTDRTKARREPRSGPPRTGGTTNRRHGFSRGAATPQRRRENRERENKQRRRSNGAASREKYLRPKTVGAVSLPERERERGLEVPPVAGYRSPNENRGGTKSQREQSDDA